MDLFLLQLPATIIKSSMTVSAGSDVKCVKAWGVIQNSPDAIHDLLWGETKEDKLKDDDTMVDHKVVEQVSDYAQIIYQRFKLPWPLSHRDFCFLRFFKKTDDGSCYLVRKMKIKSD